MKGIRLECCPFCFRDSFLPDLRRRGLIVIQDVHWYTRAARVQENNARLQREMCFAEGMYDYTASLWSTAGCSPADYRCAEGRFLAAIGRGNSNRYSDASWEKKNWTFQSINWIQCIDWLISHNQIDGLSSSVNKMRCKALEHKWNIIHKVR